MALLSLRLHQHFINSYLHPNIPTKAFLSINGGQITLVMGEILIRDVLFGHPADLHSFSETKGESISDDIQVLGRISFCALVQLSFPFPRWLSSRGCSELLEPSCIP